MIGFEFITWDELRRSLEMDYAELGVCLEAGAWKAVHVLAGSIIEAVLTDHLLSDEGGNGLTQDEVTAMSLGQIITLCRRRKALTQRTVDLSSVIRDYRNLIHPGRSIRLSEGVDSQSARVAQSLVEIVVKEIADQKRREYGYTAVQLCDKLENDSSAVAILPHLLLEVRPVERERLLLTVLPDRYLDLERNAASQAALTALRRAFRVILSAVDEKVIRKVLHAFVVMLKEDDEYKIGTYEEAFFSSEDLEFVEPADREIVKSHLFALLEPELTDGALGLIRGIGPYLFEEDLDQFLAPFARAVVVGNTSHVSELYRILDEEYKRMTPALQSRVLQWFDDRGKRLSWSGRSDQAKKLHELKEYLDLPF